MEFSIAELAERFDVGYQGDASIRVDGVCTLHPGMPGRITFLNNSRYRPYLADTRASAVILAPADAGRCPVACLISDNPYLLYARVAALFRPPRPVVPGVHESAVVAGGARVADGAGVGPLAVIESGATVEAGAWIGPGCVVRADAVIGADSQLIANVYVGPGCRLGRRVLLHPGVVIGADGFGLARDGERWVNVPQLGAVVLGDDVEIGANSTVDRGAIEDTIVESGVKLDNQIQVGHNVRIGEHTVIAGCVGIAGSANIGRRCQIGGGAGIGGHIDIADDTIITGMTMVTHSLREAGIYSSGMPVESNRRWRRIIARLRHIDDLAARIAALEKSVEADPAASGKER